MALSTGHSPVDNVSGKHLTFDAELEKLHHESFNYFLHETNPANGLVIDKTEADWPASVAATGLALASYPMAVERRFMPRAEAVERALMTPRSFRNSPQRSNPIRPATRAFTIIFSTCRPAGATGIANCQQQTALFCWRGALTAGMYFAADRLDEQEIRRAVGTR